MGLPIIGDILDQVGKIASEVIVDKDKKIDIAFKLEQLKDEADKRFHEELIAQTEVNKVEAAHSSLFVAGWRPAVGWVGVFGLGYTFIISPFLGLVVDTVPTVDTNTLMTLVLGMLGIGAQRTFEKIKGVATGNLTTKNK
jgi:hypothetical protein